jgi:hypothetical protein
MSSRSGRRGEQSGEKARITISAAKERRDAVDPGDIAAVAAALQVQQRDAPGNLRQ